MNIYYVYVLASRHHRYVSVRVTADLKYGVRHHRRAISRKLGRRKVYQKLVYVEAFNGLTAAVERERQITGWSSARLRQLVSGRNPAWKPISISRYLSRRRHEKSLRTSSGYRGLDRWAT